MVPWLAMSDSGEPRRISDLEGPLHPDDEEVVRKIALLKHTFPRVDFDLTEAGLKKLTDFLDKHFQDD